MSAAEEDCVYLVVYFRDRYLNRSPGTLSQLHNSRITNLNMRIPTRIRPVPSPELRTLKRLVWIAVAVAAVYFLFGGSTQSEQTQVERKYKPLPKANMSATILPNREEHPPVWFEIPDELEQPASDDSIKWLIEASKREDSRIDRAALLQRSELLDEIEQSHEKYGTDLEILLHRKQVYPIPDLNILRHRKFTSPTIAGSGFFSTIRSFFTRDPYDNVERILEVGNTQPWRSDGNRVTLFSSTNISPYYLRIRMASDSDNQRISLFGLRIEQDNLAVIKTFSSYFLGWFDLADCDRDGSGARYLPCTAPNCVSSYTFLMLIMEKVAIYELEIYATRSL